MAVLSTCDAILIRGAKHLLYQDRGVSGTEVKRDTVHYYSDKKPPMAPFLAMIKLKNIQLADNEKYYGDPSKFKEVTEEDKQKSLAYAMRESIYKKGFAGHNFWTPELNQLVDDLKQNAVGFTIAKLKQDIDVKDSAKGLFPKP